MISTDGKAMLPIFWNNDETWADTLRHGKVEKYNKSNIHNILCLSCAEFLMFITLLDLPTLSIGAYCLVTFRYRSESLREFTAKTY